MTFSIGHLRNRGEFMFCNFCSEATDSDKVDKDAKSYICSNCVQLLFNLSQEQLSKAYDLSIAKGYTNKADAIKSFLEVETDEQRNRRYTAKRINGKRPLRIDRNEQKSNRGFKKPKGPALYQIEHHEPAVL